MTETGPPYPHPNPVPGSNSIGSFAVGISPIGTIPPFDYWSTVISQYGNSSKLTALIGSFNAAMDLTEDLDSFFDLMFNVATAQGFGLDCWGRIVGVSRTLHLPSTSDYFGFDEAGSWSGFGQSPFYTGGALTSNFNLLDADYRVLIYAKAAGNISDGSIESINAILMGLFPGRGNAYVTDGEDMTMSYNFTFTLTPVELAIVTQSGVLPKPVGVTATVVQP